MSIVGIDLSVHAIDVVHLSEDDDTAFWTRYPLAATDSFLAARNVRDALPGRSEWRDTGVIAFAVEKPFSRSYKAVSALMRVQGAIVACLPPELLVCELAPTEWKTATVGQGNAGKGDVAAWVFRRYTEAFVEDWPQDGLDAYAIAWALRALVERGEAEAA